MPVAHPALQEDDPVRYPPSFFVASTAATFLHCGRRRRCRRRPTLWRCSRGPGRAGRPACPPRRRPHRPARCAPRCQSPYLDTPRSAQVPGTRAAPCRPPGRQSSRPLSPSDLLCGASGGFEPAWASVSALGDCPKCPPAVSTSQGHWALVATRRPGAATRQCRGQTAAAPAATAGASAAGPGKGPGTPPWAPRAPQRASCSAGRLRTRARATCGASWRSRGVQGRPRQVEVTPAGAGQDRPSGFYLRARGATARASTEHLRAYPWRSLCTCGRTCGDPCVPAGVAAREKPEAGTPDGSVSRHFPRGVARVSCAAA
eukprot:scaffold69_cov248-Pinguiococcus_pyrenoidosus.AAC.56